MMENVQFKARITICFQSNIQSESQLKSDRAFVQKFFPHLLGLVALKCECSAFVYHPDESAEASGYYNHGVYVDIDQEIKPQNRYQASKFLDGLCGILNNSDRFLRCEFELLS